MRLSPARCLSPVLALTILPGVLLSVLTSQGALPALPPAFEPAAVDRYVAAWVKEKGLVGLAITVVRDGRTVLAKGYGQAVLGDTNRPVQLRTRFAVGSLTKQFACACIWLLAEDGKLSVEDKVATYYPGLTRAQDISLLDLMQHTSGYPDYYPLDYVDQRMRRAIDPDDLLRQYAGGSLDFEPGSNYSYSNTGYILLGRVVEKVSGESFGSFLERRILRPLGMGDTLYEPAADAPNLAQGYSNFALSPPEPIDPEGRGWLGAAGGLYSTGADLARWNLALIDGRVLKPSSFRAMIAPRALTTGKVSDYGCGLGVRTQNGRPLLSHSGAVAGFNAWNVVIPSTASSISLLCNLDGGLGTLPGQLLGLLLKETPPVPKVAAAPAVETARALFKALQEGRIDRAGLSADFNAYLTEQRLQSASQRLRAHGQPTASEQISIHERGGMEVTVCRLTFKKGPLRTLMYRRPNGLVEQFFVYPD